MSENHAGQTPGQTIDQEDGADVRVPALLRRGRVPQAYCSLKADTDADRAKLLAALTSRVPKLSDKINQQVAVRNVILQPVERVDRETGEAVPATRIVLMLADGTMVGCMSDGIRSSLAAIFQLWGEPPWADPLVFTVRQTEVGDNRRWFSLEYVSGKGNPKPKK